MNNKINEAQDILGCPNQLPSLLMGDHTASLGHPDQSAYQQREENTASPGCPDQLKIKWLAEWTDTELATAIEDLRQLIDERMMAMEADHLDETEQAEQEALANLAFDQREALQIERLRRDVEKLKAAIAACFPNGTRVAM